MAGEKCSVCDKPLTDAMVEGLRALGVATDVYVCPDCIHAHVQAPQRARVGLVPPMMRRAE